MGRADVRPGELAWSCASPASFILVATMNNVAGPLSSSDTLR